MDWANKCYETNDYTIIEERGDREIYMYLQ